MNFNKLVDNLINETIEDDSKPIQVLVEISDETYEYIVDAAEDLNPGTMNSYFGGQQRIVIPLQSSDNKEVQKFYDEIVNPLASKGIYVDLKDGTAKQYVKTQKGTKERVSRLGKVINKHMSDETKAWWNKNQANFLGHPEILDNKYSIVISQSPVDVARMSDYREIQSCHSPGSDYFQCALADARRAGAIAYLIESKDAPYIESHANDAEVFADADRDIEGVTPLARVRLRRIDYIDESGFIDALLVPETRVYGRRVPGFVNTVIDWAREEQDNHEFFKKKLDTNKLYHRGGRYSDSDFSTMFNNLLGLENIELNDDLDMYYPRDTNSISPSDDEAYVDHVSTEGRQRQMDHAEEMMNDTIWENMRHDDVKVDYDLEYDEWGEGVVIESWKVTMDFDFPIDPILNSEFIKNNENVNVDPEDPNSVKQDELNHRSVWSTIEALINDAYQDSDYVNSYLEIPEVDAQAEHIRFGQDGKLIYRIKLVWEGGGNLIPVWDQDVAQEIYNVINDIDELKEVFTEALIEEEMYEPTEYQKVRKSIEYDEEELKSRLDGKLLGHFRFDLAGGEFVAYSNEPMDNYPAPGIRKGGKFPEWNKADESPPLAHILGFNEENFKGMATYIAYSPKQIIGMLLNLMWTNKVIDVLRSDLEEAAKAAEDQLALMFLASDGDMEEDEEWKEHKNALEILDNIYIYFSSDVIYRGGESPYTGNAPSRRATGGLYFKFKETDNVYTIRGLVAFLKYFDKNYNVVQDALQAVWDDFVQAYNENAPIAQEEGLQFLRNMIQEAITDGSGPLGNFVLPAERKKTKGATPTEPNTKIEDQLADTLRRHFASGKYNFPREMSNLLIKMVRSGSYPKIFKRATKGNLYRGMELTEEQFVQRFGPIPPAAKWYKSPLKAWRRRGDRSGGTFSPKTKPTYKRGGEVISSWTDSESTAKDFADAESYGFWDRITDGTDPEDIKGKVAVVMVAKASNPRNFFMDLRPFYEFTMGDGYEDEREFLAFGDVTVDELHVYGVPQAANESLYTLRAMVQEVINETMNIEDHPQRESIIAALNDPNYLVHFSDINKVGINPGTQYNTPAGIYGWHWTDNILDRASKNTLFGSKRKFAHLMKIRDGAKVLWLGDDEKTGQLPGIAQAADILFNEYPDLGEKTEYYFPHDGQSWALQEPFIDWIQDKYPKFAKTSYRKHGGESRTENLYDFIMAVSRLYADEILKDDTKRTIVANKMLRLLGFDAVIDTRGEGIIHGNEPQQGFFTNIGGLDTVATIDNEIYSMPSTAVMSILLNPDAPADKIEEALTAVLETDTDIGKSGKGSVSFSLSDRLDILDYATQKNTSLTTEQLNRISKFLEGVDEESDSWLMGPAIKRNIISHPNVSDEMYQRVADEVMSSSKPNSLTVSALIRNPSKATPEFLKAVAEGEATTSLSDKVIALRNPNIPSDVLLPYIEDYSKFFEFPALYRLASSAMKNSSVPRSALLDLLYDEDSNVVVDNNILRDIVTNPNLPVEAMSDILETIKNKERMRDEKIFVDDIYESFIMSPFVPDDMALQIMQEYPNLTNPTNWELRAADLLRRALRRNYTEGSPKKVNRRLLNFVRDTFEDIRNKSEYDMTNSQQGDIMGLLNAQGAYKNQDSPQKEPKDWEIQDQEANDWNKQLFGKNESQDLSQLLKDMISEQIKIAIGEKQEDSPEVTKVVLNDGRRVLLIKRSDEHENFARMWDLPGGHIHVNEDKITGLEREVKEETGLCIEDPNELYSLKHETFYIADLPDAPIKLSSEHTEHKLVDIDDIPGHDDLSPKYKDVILTAMEDAPLTEGRILSENSHDFVMYHSTSPENVDNILSQGLEIGRESAHTQAGEWADEHYGERPIYLSKEIGKYEGSPLAVNTEGIFLVADLPALAGDHGANVGEETLWWNLGEEPEDLEPYLEDGEIHIFDLLNDPEVIEAAIKTTGTAAATDKISPERIQPASDPFRLAVENKIISEMFVKGDPDGDNIVAYRENIWRMGDIPSDEVRDDINDSIGIEAEWEGFYDLKDELDNENRMDVLFGTLLEGGKTLHLDQVGSFKLDPKSSILVKKVVKELGARKIVYPADYNWGDEEEVPFYGAKGKVADVMYHGTTSNYLENILKFGLVPGESQTNYEGISHPNAVFFSSRMEEAQHHAVHTASKVGGDPVIASLNVPDPALLIPDYDVDMGAGDTGCFDYICHTLRNRQAGDLDVDSFSLSREVGVYGYKGRIPASAIFAYDILMNAEETMDSAEMYDARLGEYTEATPEEAATYIETKDNLGMGALEYPEWYFDDEDEEE